MLTHQVSIDPGRQIVVKRFVQADRGEPAREWRALTLLAEHAPGLAPEPILADLAADPPVIEMSLLAGEPLGGGPLTPDQELAVVRAVGQLWQSVPVSLVTPVENEENSDVQLVQQVREMAAQGHDLGADPVVRKARSAGLDWMSWAVPASGQPGLGSAAAGIPRVFGQGDANLANFLFDGERVRIVDFEDSGVSDRAFELAVFVEHISAWSDAGLAGERFISAFDLTVAERARLADWRRLAALYWLLRLRPGGGAEERNPPGTLRRQAERLLALL
jgi:Phosphotransferase enzyme family